MIKLGVLGTGIITECHFFALDKIDTAKVAAIASLDEQEGKKVCEHFGAVYYKDYKELLAKEKELDGIIVALPNHMHYQGCVDVIEAGFKNILCEKPLCITSEQSRKLVELVHKEGIMFQTGYMKRFNPGFQKVKELADKMGELEFVTFSIFNSAPEPEISGKNEAGSWHDDARLSGGGFLTHSGSHHLDLLRYCFGDIHSVACKTRYDNADGRDYFLDASLKMEKGFDIGMKLGRVDIRNLGPQWKPFRDGWNESVEVIGTRGYLRVDNPSWQGYEVMQVTMWLQGMCGPETFSCECKEQWISELSAFVENCGTGSLREGCSSVVDGYRVDYTIEKMRESGELGGKEITLDYQY